MRINVYLFCFLLLSLSVRAQSPFVPLNADYYHLIDRLEIRQNKWAEGFHSSVKPYNRQSIIQLTDSVAAHPNRDFSDTDYFNFDYLRNDSWEWVAPRDSLKPDPFTSHLKPPTSPGDSQKPFLTHFYKKKADFYNLQTPDIDLHVNPVVYLGFGAENASSPTGTIDNGNQALFVNTRGLEVRGSIGRKLGFYTFFADNQAIYPEYIQRYGLTYGQGNNTQPQVTAPGEGFVKPYRTTGADFLTARGYITFNTLKVINVQFGHDRNFFGNGFRSLFLSDNSPAYLFLKLSTKLGRRIQYTNLFTSLQNTQAPRAQDDKLIPPKFAAMHHLSINLGDHMNLGVFEAEVFSRDRLDLSYLNPIILYRYVESSLGSSDNAFIGIDFKANFLSHFLVYTQFMLDEFRLKPLLAGKGDWTNKFALQVGAKYIDAFTVPNLDLQAEFNLARPYTYSHEASPTVTSGQTNYAHYSQPLAHPLGGNFMEGLGIVRFQRKKLSVNGIFGVMMYGTDQTAEINYGGNILKDYNSRIRNEGNFIGQGRKTVVTYADVRASYMIRHNIFLEGRYLYRYQDSQYRPDSYTDQTASFALRWNLPYKNWVF
ncbi:hypothetical protein [Spirosoma pollinicola]|uniref:Capsule assembly Wzi family protein n=1 Tax=Spirosoma pollinicola TaxID=2057025 RepID=A0A2K8YZZ8_9BACT|nr:hypothetical protein [Spirosoma pollinicola]AUD03220.1 hypothetical protein CWM47_16080 [Spirosoma pollinicola]